MSIHVLLNQAVAQGLLFRVEPTMPSDPMNRDLFVSPAVHLLITGPWKDKEEEVRCGRLWADFDRFVVGGRLPVSLNDPHRKPIDAYLARLHPAEEEVWEIRSRAPKPGLRVFGRFAYKDCFVAFNWRLRKELGGAISREFQKEALDCLAAWRRTFPACDPYNGEQHR